MVLKRINRTTNEVIDKYNFNNNEILVSDFENDRILVFQNKEEQEKFKNGEIQDYELQEVPYNLYGNDEFIIEE